MIAPKSLYNNAFNQIHSILLSHPIHNGFMMAQLWGLRITDT
ncbi:protein of unknown function [Pseudomonas sp. JV241A]|nr:protein of unknown function [Pseudomonas sp. JV241A]